MSWVMNLKGHKIFQFDRLRRLKKSVGGVASNIGLVFLAYMEANIFICWVFFVMHLSFLFLVFVFPMVPLGRVEVEVKEWQLLDIFYP